MMDDEDMKLVKDLRRTKTRHEFVFPPMHVGQSEFVAHCSRLFMDAYEERDRYGYLCHYAAGRIEELVGDVKDLEVEREKLRLENSGLLAAIRLLEAEKERLR